jgi:ABC-type Fe3+-siderophore transport system permease subunit
MRLQFSLRALLLAVFVVAILLAVLRPVAKITPATCERIRPGMTEQEAFQLVGVPPGWYDGVGGISTNAPAFKGYKPFWVGAGGEMVVDLDDSGRVTKATFYPAKALDWSFGDRLWERLTRMRFLGLSLPQRSTAFLAGTTLAVWALAVIVIRPRTPNHLAKHGALGLTVGALTGIALFAELFFWDLTATLFLLIGPILGAALGIVVGFCRKTVVQLAATRMRRTDVPQTVT